MYGDVRSSAGPRMESVSGVGAVQLHAEPPVSGQVTTTTTTTLTNHNLSSYYITCIA